MFENSLVFIFVGVAIIFTGYITKKFAFKPDNLVEEAAEEVIKIKTGHDVDLTPDSPEKKDVSE